ncbi:MAG: MBL fold metallo-hydrolase [Bacteroidia bacterium]|nr:MBL fold metallo-hydrolase [Bacteroidia bacterium]
MLQLQKFTFNPMQENTYIVYNDAKQAMIIDPGCYDVMEQNILSTFISKNDLNPVLLVNTHCHIDHIFGNAYVSQLYNLPLHAHKEEEKIVDLDEISATRWQLNYTKSPRISTYLVENTLLKLGNDEFEIRFVPGHSPGSVALYNAENNFCIVGDALFNNSIGRTDLPFGNHEQLLLSIRTQLFTLPENTQIYSGHGSVTTIAKEKTSNPFLK